MISQISWINCVLYMSVIFTSIISCIVYINPRCPGLYLTCNHYYENNTLLSTSDWADWHSNFDN